ncbi:RNA-guided endonuclease InsQ/TnpB family protein [Bacillus cereus]|uniref:Putative transposase n=1 Tax=Bacillus cereus TaxID=1396 RepID=A0A164QEM9_BACCE|nr:RNA-guided endonuclease TnpB family protein [Bacillus cereus]KZD71210.1 putative transposase [Bacillus cereus]
MKHFRTYQFRLYPTTQQLKSLQESWSLGTFIYKAFDKFHNEVSLRQSDTQLLLNRLSHHYPILHTVSRIFLEQAATQTWDKKHKSFQGYTFKDYRLHNARLYIKGMNPIKIVQSRAMPSKPHKVTLVQKDGKWYASFLVSLLNEVNKPETYRIVGVDMGLKDFITLSNGKHISHPKFWKQFEDKVKVEHQKLARKQRGSNEWLKQQGKLRRVYRKLSRVRHDFLHQVSRHLVSSFDVICFESISLSSLNKKKHLRKSLQDTAWSTFIQYVCYKAEAEGKKVIFAERFFPSTKRCSHCSKVRDISLSERVYTCECGFVCDRDENAAKNLEWYGKQALITSTKKRGFPYRFEVNI